METPKPLASEKPEKVKSTGFSEQICMRCAKKPAVLGEIFCAKCLLEREEFDARNRISEENSKEFEKSMWDDDADED